MSDLKTKCSVIVATYGDREWQHIAMTRAVPSVVRQLHHDHELMEVLITHSDTASLAYVRNGSAEAAYGEWLIFLDADDELAPGYIAAMLAGSGDIRVPRIQYIDAGVEREPVTLCPKHLLSGNYIPIGAMIRRQDFLAVGGFPEYRAYEDWALFTRLWARGASIAHCPGAVYRAHYNPAGRNCVPDSLELFHTIQKDLLRFIPKEKLP